MRPGSSTSPGPPAEVLQLDEQAPDFSPGEGQGEGARSRPRAGPAGRIHVRRQFVLTAGPAVHASREAAGKVVAVGAGVDPALCWAHGSLGPTLFRGRRGGCGRGSALVHARRRRSCCPGR